jgi:NADH-quinone oxidoreductase subunit L
MMSLSISSSMLQLYVFWELVGLSSYLLIGFWYERFSASQAGKKAFVMTRLGDFAFFIGIAMVHLHFGSLNILEMNGADVTARMSPALITFSAMCIFGGIVGKSAQFPLLTWLPDAMEGPTPVSALLHSATMVAAGVFLFARLFPFFSYSPSAMTLFLIIGTISMLLASTMAMVDRDIKKIWAYSTISQLGFMIMGLAAGSFFAGLFHLSTHAGFKALLFLCSGIWIHAYATNDIFEIGRRGGRRFKIPMVCIVLAAAALAGLPPLSGFFSKEVILGALAAQGNPVWLIAGLIGVFLTSYYGFRPIFIILFPGQAKDVHHHEQVTGARERFSYWAMAAPLLVLAGITVVLGFFQAPLENGLLGHASTVEHVGGSYVWLLYVTIGVSVCGVGLAWFEFGRKGSSQIGFVEKIPPLRALFSERWYIDHFYQRFVHYIVDGFFSKLSTQHDRQVIDGGIDGFSRLIIGSGRLLAFLQSGVLRYNLVLMFAVLAVVALYFFFS